jgi:hypothetical protein
MFRDEPHQCLTGEVENYSVDLFDDTVMELDGARLVRRSRVCVSLDVADSFRRGRQVGWERIYEGDGDKEE